MSDERGTPCDFAGATNQGVPLGDLPQKSLSWDRSENASSDAPSRRHMSRAGAPLGFWVYFLHVFLDFLWWGWGGGGLGFNFLAFAWSFLGFGGFFQEAVLFPREARHVLLRGAQEKHGLCFHEKHNYPSCRGYNPRI